MATTIATMNPATLAPQLGRAAIPADTTGSSSSTSDSNGATISANDFLTLLVTEMQNQDPTDTTDPNEYINQLVNVNSLEQLISINQTLQTATGATGSSTPSSGIVRAAGAALPANSGQSSAFAPAPKTEAQATTHAIQDRHPFGGTAGNLAIPPSSAAAQRVAQALSGARATGK